MKRIHFAHPYLLNPQHPINIALVGVGGTGSQVLTHLAKIHTALVALDHIGLHVTAYDDDIVTEANIGRQLYSTSDIGLNKAQVLISRINRYFGFNWKSVSAKYKGEKCNIVISCIDTAKGRIQIGKLIKNESVYVEPFEKFLYWLDFGNLQNSGQVILGLSLIHI